MKAIVLLLQLGSTPIFPSIPLPGTEIPLDSIAAVHCSGAMSMATIRLRTTARWEIDGLRRRSVTGEPDRWITGACQALVLADRSAIALQGFLMPLGDSWMHGARRIVDSVLMVHPHHPDALNLLASIVLHHPSREANQRSLGTFTLNTGSRDPLVLRACTTTAFARGDESIVSRCASEALAAGIDSTWHQLRLARLSFREADTTAGEARFIAAIRSMKTLRDTQEVSWHLQWFLSPSEHEAWNAGPDAPDRWVRDRLLSRDVRDGRPIGSRLAEHFARWEHVQEHFWLDPVPIKRKSLATGPAERERMNPMFMDGEVRGDPAGRTTMLWRDYPRWQIDIDDRGVVWMRFGKPMKIDADVIADGLQQVWYYEIDGRPLILGFEPELFDGSPGPTRLVSGMLGQSYCSIDTHRCNLTTKAIAAAELPGLPGVKVEAIDQVRLDDQIYIETAVTQDDNSIRTEHHVTVTAQHYRVWDPASGRLLAVMPWSIRHSDLATDGGLSIRLEVRQWDPLAEAWHDTTMATRLIDANGRRSDAWISGVATLPTSVGVGSWSITARQGYDRSGRQFADGMAPIGTGPVSLSDLILGVEGSGSSWRGADEPVPLWPSGVFEKSTPIELYYQIRNDGSPAEFDAAVAIYRIGRNAPTTPALEIRIPARTVSGINEVRRTIGIGELDGGSYRIEVTISSPGGPAIISRSSNFRVR